LIIRIELVSCPRQRLSNLNMSPLFMTNDNQSVQARCKPIKDCIHVREKHAGRTVSFYGWKPNSTATFKKIE
jgi:hypothetical protein